MDDGCAEALFSLAGMKLYLTPQFATNALTGWRATVLSGDKRMLFTTHANTRTGAVRSAIRWLQIQKRS